MCIKKRMGEKRYKLGLALSGGGMRAFSHLGVLKALEEKIQSFVI